MDLISRQAAIEAVRNMWGIVSPISDEVLLIDKAQVQTELMMLPTAKPSTTLMQVEVGVDKEMLKKAMEEAELTLVAEPRKGKWVYDEERGATGIYAICTACNEMIYQTGEFNYCPRCGARMEE